MNEEKKNTRLSDAICENCQDRTRRAIFTPSSSGSYHKQNANLTLANARLCAEHCCCCCLFHEEKFQVEKIATNIDEFGYLSVRSFRMNESIREQFSNVNACCAMATLPPIAVCM